MQLLKKKIEDLDVVRLKDGREGTIIHVVPGGNGYLVDFGTEDTMMTEVTAEEVESIIWEPKKQD